MKVILDIIHGNKTQNEFMHHCDVFENSKQLGKHEELCVSGKDGIDIDNLTTNLKDAYEKSGRNVVFVSVKQVGSTLTNDYERYIMPNVSTISSGKKWGMFKDGLERMGYEVETDEHMRVTGVTIKTISDE